MKLNDELKIRIGGLVGMAIITALSVLGVKRLIDKATSWVIHSIENDPEFAKWLFNHVHEPVGHENLEDFIRPNPFSQIVSRDDYSIFEKATLDQESLGWMIEAMEEEEKKLEPGGDDHVQLNKVLAELRKVKTNWDGPDSDFSKLNSAIWELPDPSSQIGIWTCILKNPCDQCSNKTDRIGPLMNFVTDGSGDTVAFGCLVCAKLWLPSEVEGVEG